MKDDGYMTKHQEQELNLKLNEHSNLLKMLEDAKSAMSQSVEDEDYWDYWNECEIIKKELADTEDLLNSWMFENGKMKEKN